MRAINRRSGEQIAANVIVADTVLRRMKGLLGKERLPPGEALWLRPCSMVHTLGMKFPIDILFLDGENTVLRTVEGVPPNRFSAYVSRAGSALELPAGTVSRTGTKAGDKIEVG